ncbi:MAG: 6-phosphogluconolactonase [Acidimicrobiales bacterium]|nr:MAG: 6-phosphogluconolactonase [Acidimicrobiales bacterium]
MSGTHVVVHPSGQLLAEAAAARLLARLADVQAARGVASLVLAGGGVVIQSLAAMKASPARDAVDWSRVDVWWSDERFLVSGDPQRNETQARRALLDAVALNPDRIHPMPAAVSSMPDAEGTLGTAPHNSSADDGAAAYRDELARQATPGKQLPQFDVLLLGVGPEGHTASIFPESPAVHEQRPVVAVHRCPKPPPTRITMTLPTICSAEEVWLLAVGEPKAAAIGMALSGAGEAQIPAAGARGQLRTLWLLDRAAAAEVPAQLRTPW